MSDTRIRNYTGVLNYSQRTKLILWYGYEGINKEGDRESIPVLESSKMFPGFLPLTKYVRLADSALFTYLDDYEHSLCDDYENNVNFMTLIRNYSFLCNGKNYCRDRFDFVVNALNKHSYQIKLTNIYWDNYPDLDPIVD